MDKQTLSHYGWIIIVTLVLAVLMAFATPFGEYVGEAASSALKGYGSVNEDAMDIENIEKLEGEWGDKFDKYPSADESWDTPTSPSFEVITRPEKTLPSSTEPTTEETGVRLPMEDPSANKLTIYYTVNRSADEYTISYPQIDGIIYNKNRETPFTQVIQFGTTYPNGLVNATSFGLTKEGYKFVGWKIKGIESSTVFDQNDETLTPEKITEAIYYGDAEIYLEAVWSKQIAIYYKVPNTGVHFGNDFYYPEDGYICESDYFEPVVQYVSAEDTVTIYSDTYFSIDMGMDYEFRNWRIGSSARSFSGTMPVSELLAVSPTKDAIYLEAVWEQTWF
jgi:hypothetical protein